MSNITALRCRECAHEAPIGATHVCDLCFGPLEVAYDEDAVAAVISRERIESGPATMWRYADLLPRIGDDPALQVDLGTGFTPLRPAPRLGERLGLDDLWLKDDTRNPSGSFKDRVVTVALTAARDLGIGTVACASTGNLANAVAAHAAAVGLDAYVFVPHDLESAKIVASAVYGAKVVSVKGNYDDVNRLCAEIAEDQGWGFANVNLRAYYAEGSKTIGFEIAEQLGWALPDHVVLPVASGAMLTKVHKAFGELQRYGLVESKTPRISGAQAAGCNPVATAFREGTRDIRPVRPDTLARSLAIGNPADGYYAVGIVADTGGAVEDATDPEILDGMRLLAETEGIFAETAGGVTVASLRKLAASGAVASGERVVAVISGNGFKTVETLESSVGPAYHVSPSLEDFTTQLG